MSVFKVTNIGLGETDGLKLELNELLIDGLIDELIEGLIELLGLTDGLIEVLKDGESD
jgi:hypothetical protein